MTNLQRLEEKLKRLYDLKRVIKKGEKIFKGDARVELALEFENTLSVEGIEYDRADFKTMTIFTFPSEPITEEIVEEHNEDQPQENQW